MYPKTIPETALFSIGLHGYMQRTVKSVLQILAAQTALTLMTKSLSLSEQ